MNSASVNPDKNKKAKLPKIALVIDHENWAFHNYSRQISKQLESIYDFRIVVATNYKNTALLLIDVQDCDLIHFFWRADLFKILSSDVQRYFKENEQDYRRFLVEVVAKANITTSVYDHLYLSEDDLKRYKIIFNVLCNGYTTCSEKLNQIYSHISEYPKPDCVAEDGVDFEMFQPLNLQRFETASNELVVGWAGNSKWGEGEYIDHKGLETIIKPAIKSLNADGYKIRGLFADRQEKWIPHSQMNDYYNSIDVYVCASDSEGKPDPVLEAMTCGLPVISTNVGVIPQVFGRLQKEYIMPIKSVEELKNKLQRLLENRHSMAVLSEENLISIQKWSWKNQSKKWKFFFDKMLLLSQNIYQQDRIVKLKQYTLETNINYLTEKELASQIPFFQSKVVELEDRINYKDNYNNILENKVVKGDQLNIDLANKILEKDLHIEMLISENSEKDKFHVDFSEKMRSKIVLMEGSKFWKARNLWFNFKNKCKKG